MLKQLRKALMKYLKNVDKVALFGIFIVLTLILTPIISSFTSVGAGFIRFTSIYSDLTVIQFLVLLGVGGVSLLFISVFLSGLISLIKLQETLDNVTYEKVISTFRKYVKKMFLFLVLVTSISVAIGTVLSYLGAPSTLIHLLIVAIWLSVAFTPQVITIEDFALIESLRDSFEFIKKHPAALAEYIAVGFILMLFLTALEAFLGQIFTWEHKIITVILVSVVVLPLLQIYATELYLKRYPLTNI